MLYASSLFFIFLKKIITFLFAFIISYHLDKNMFDWIQAIQYANYDVLRVVVDDLKARVEAVETQRALATSHKSTRSSAIDSVNETLKEQSASGSDKTKQSQTDGFPKSVDTSERVAPPAIPRPYHESMQKP